MSSTKKVPKFLWVPVKLNYNITSLSEDESDKLIDPAGSLVKYYFHTPEGKAYISLKCMGKVFEYHGRDYYGDNHYLVRNQANIHCKTLLKFLQGYFCKTEAFVKNTPNGMFFFIESDDGYYGTPTFKLFRV
jgi:hypothetical protein